ncbi:recQ-mediated genome instability protein 1-like [Bradysia coprophila]|uniref:recQ-mediated genome instability protein 1-like n=1 Tax=Bradysia coprophila TaxID=38358 RepID=UPI00187DD3D0|nr:recQ-mediated genome instability protein 1-like [Bradysia coprophila]
MIADFDTHVRDTNRRFAAVHISVDQDWLGGCVEWFLSETPRISNENLYKNAYEQWLLSDLAESGVKCLPQSVLSNKNEFKFTGNYALQMQYVIDIAESAYEQYRTIHDKKLDEAEEPETEQRQRNISKKRRTLKLELTDGHTTVTAMEHCPIPCLNTKMVPGIKILIKGSMRCVNKVLFLQPGNVTVLGGEVEKLSIENAYENVLLKAMGRPITSTPRLDYKETTVAEQHKPTLIMPPAPPPVVHHNPQTPRNIMHDDDDDLFSNLDIDYLNTNVATNQSIRVQQNSNVAANQPTAVQQSNPTTNVNQFLDDDDDIFFEADIPDASVTNNIPKSNHNAFDDDDDFDVAEVEANIQLNLRNEERRHVSSNAITESSLRSTVEATQNQLDFDSDIDEMFSRNSVIERAVDEFKIAGCPLVTILQLHSLDDSEKSERSFVVKCEIFKTVESIRIVSNRYEIVVLITDSTGLQLEVKVNNDVIADWADVTAEELQRMRQTINQRPQQRQQMENILKKLSDTMTAFDGFMRIEYSHKNQMPEVTEVIESKAEYEEILRKKLAKRI